MTPFGVKNSINLQSWYLTILWTAKELCFQLSETQSKDFQTLAVDTRAYYLETHSIQMTHFTRLHVWNNYLEIDGIVSQIRKNRLAFKWYFYRGFQVNVGCVSLSSRLFRCQIASVSFCVCVFSFIYIYIYNYIYVLFFSFYSFAFLCVYVRSWRAFVFLKYSNVNRKTKLNFSWSKYLFSNLFSGTHLVTTPWSKYSAKGVPFSSKTFFFFTVFSLFSYF